MTAKSVPSGAERNTDVPEDTASPPNADSEEHDVNAPYGLSPAEQNWSIMQSPLEGLGYMLRPRYREGWVGSWVGSKKKPERCEDSIGISAHNIVIDAERVSDGVKVLLKLWSRSRRDAMELPVLRYFSDPSRAIDPKNHCIPLLDVVDIPGWSEYFDHILVEPLLRPWTEPPFVMVAEVLSWTLQVLEGLEYMHTHNVAHGDIHPGNILMDPSKLYPKGFNSAITFDVDNRLSERGVKRATRLRVPVRYYYIDFGSSSMFSSLEERQPVFLNAVVYEPPEMKANPSAPIDPFKADVYALGVTILAYLRLHPQLRGLLPVLVNMVSEKPDERPTAQEALESFKTALKLMSPRQMRRKLSWKKTEQVSILRHLWDWKEYIRVLWDSHRYGLPKDILGQ